MTTRLRDLGAPFVVTVGTYIFDSDRWHSANALYGQEAVQVGETSDGGVVTRVVRQPDGYFGVPGNWRRHPDPLHPLADDLFLPAVTVDFDGSRLIETAATVTAAEMFELPDPWPPGERWPDD